MGEIIMPSLGADMEDGKLAEWLIGPGDEVKRGDIIAVVETQKGAIEIEAFQTGVVESLAVPVGQVVPVGMPIARLHGAEPQPVARRGPAEMRSHAAPPPFPEIPAVSPAPAHRRVSPAARRLAAQLNVDPAGVEGTGPHGAVTTGDVRRTAEEARGPKEVTRAQAKPGLDLDEMRKAIAAAMARSKREIPHYYLSTCVDLEAASRWLGEKNADRPPDERLLMAALFVKATALALTKHPVFNGTYQEGRFQPGNGIHIGAAVAIRGGGLIAPAIHDCDQFGLDDLMAHMRDLVARVRSGRLRSSEMTDPTITVSSLGERGVEALYGVIYPPQVALIGFGRVADTVLAVDGTPQVRPAVTLSLAGDHRVSDGHSGGLFLRRIGRLLQEPDRL